MDVKFNLTLVRADISGWSDVIAGVSILSRGATDHLYVTTGLESGGAERTLVSFATKAADLEQAPVVVSLLPDGHFRPILERAGVRVTDLGMKRGRLSFAALVKLVRVIRQVGAPVMKSWMYHANILALVALFLSGRRSRTRLLWGVYTSELDFSKYSRLLFIVFRLGAWLSPLVDGIVYNSRAALNFHRAAGYNPPFSVVIDNGVDTDCFRPDPVLRTTVRRELGLSDDQFVLLAIARPDPMKSWGVLLEAVRDIPGLTLLMVGKNTEDAQAGPNGVGLGERNDVERLTAAADLFILISSFGEGMSLAATEAMASGLPMVLTDVGDNRRMAGDSAVLVPVGSVEAIRDAILQLMQNPGRRAAMAAYARNRAIAHFSLDQAYQRFAAVCGGTVTAENRVQAKSGPRPQSLQPADTADIVLERYQSEAP